MAGSPGARSRTRGSSLAPDCIRLLPSPHIQSGKLAKQPCFYWPECLHQEFVKTYPTIGRSTSRDNKLKIQDGDFHFAEFFADP